MKLETIMIDDVDLTRKTLRKMWYKVTNPRHKNANGADLFAIKDEYVLSVEVKKAVKPKKIGSVLRTRKVTRKDDDLIAIVLPCGYVLVEPMRDHLKCCNKSGDRFLNY